MLHDSIWRHRDLLPFLDGHLRAGVDEVLGADPIFLQDRSFGGRMFPDDLPPFAARQLGGPLLAVRPGDLLVGLFLFVLNLGNCLRVKIACGRR